MTQGIQFLSGVANHGASHESGGNDDLYEMLGMMSPIPGILEVPPRLWGAGIPSSSALTPGVVVGPVFVAPRTQTFTTIASGTAATAQVGATLCRMGLYSMDQTGALTLVARSANNTGLWAAINSVSVLPFDTTGGFPSSFTIQRGQRYALALISVGQSTNPLIKGTGGAFNTGAWSAIAGIPQAFGLGGQADLPTSIPSPAGSGFGCPWMGLSP